MSERLTLEQRAKMVYSIGADTLSKRNGVYTVRKGFYYTFGQTAEGFRDQVLKAYPDAEIIEFWKTYKPFRGGASIANSSHFGVTFRLGKDGDK